MTDAKRIEVNLEICSGFFRIPTDAIVYNITVLPAGESSATRVVERIIEVEKVGRGTAPASPGPSPDARPAPASGDNFFERCFGHLAGELAAATKAAPPVPGVGDAGRSLTALTDELVEVLRAGREAAVGHASGPQVSASLAALAERIATVSDRLAVPAAPPAATKTVTRYLFNLDAVFQTMYELCTNETVKGHIQDARARAGEIFDLDRFHDLISPKAAGYQEDDGFLTAPMGDIYAALGVVCSDKGICNLLAKMDKQKATIFLDQFLPLEVPAKEEVSVPDPEVPAGAVSADSEDLPGLLRECQDEVESLGQALAPETANQSLVGQIEAALDLGSRLNAAAATLAGPGLDAGLVRRIAAWAAFAQTMLELKASRPGLAFEDAMRSVGKGGGQPRVEEAREPPLAKADAKPLKSVSLAPEDFGEASQDDIDRLLEELS